MRLWGKTDRPAPVNPDEQPKVIGIDPITGTDRRWAAKARDLELEALPNIRAAAERWAASLTGLLGVVGLAAVIEGAKTFDGLKQPWQFLGELAFFAAAVVALIAAVFAVRAAGEVTPKVFLPGGDSLRKVSSGAVEKAVNRLATSRTLAAIAVSLVLLSSMMLWWGASDDKKPTVIDATGTTLCAAGASGGTSTNAQYAVRCTR